MTASSAGVADGGRTAGKMRGQQAVAAGAAVRNTAAARGQLHAWTRWQGPPT